MNYARLVWDVARGVRIEFPRGEVVFESDVLSKVVRNEILRQCKHSIRYIVLLLASQGCTSLMYPRILFNSARRVCSKITFLTFIQLDWSESI